MELKSFSVKHDGKALFLHLVVKDHFCKSYQIADLWWNLGTLKMIIHVFHCLYHTFFILNLFFIITKQFSGVDKSISHRLLDSMFRQNFYYVFLGWSYYFILSFRSTMFNTLVLISSPFGFTRCMYSQACFENFSSGVFWCWDFLPIPFILERSLSGHCPSLYWIWTMQDMINHQIQKCISIENKKKVKWATCPAHCPIFHQSKNFTMKINLRETWLNRNCWDIFI